MGTLGDGRNLHYGCTRVLLAKKRDQPLQLALEHDAIGCDLSVDRRLTVKKFVLSAKVSSATVD
jgi:hypothetical protein